MNRSLIPISLTAILTTTALSQELEGPLPIETNLDCSDVGIADLDGDGDNDVKYASPTGGVVAWRANDGVGKFGQATTIHEESPAKGPLSLKIEVEDFAAMATRTSPFLARRTLKFCGIGTLEAPLSPR